MNIKAAGSLKSNVSSYTGSPFAALRGRQKGRKREREREHAENATDGIVLYSR
jgi:hypothetical protein